MYFYLLQDQRTPLMYAAVGGHIDVVQVLLSRQDVDINMRDKVGNGQLTVIHYTTISCDSSTYFPDIFLSVPSL